MTAVAIARQHDSLGGKPGAVTPQGMLQKRRARLWLADVNVNTAATRHPTVPLPTGTCSGYRTMSTRHRTGLTTHRTTMMGLLWTGKATAMLSPGHSGMGRIHHRWDRSEAGNWELAVKAGPGPGPQHPTRVLVRPYCALVNTHPWPVALVAMGAVGKDARHGKPRAGQEMAV